jgi:DNA-binding transcriptional MerR regulator
MSERTFSIRELAASAGVTAHTLRYYERIGLINPVPRTESGHRSYREVHLNRVRFIRRLRSTGMPIRNILSYFELVKHGGSTIDERLAIMETHRDSIVNQIDELRQNLEQIELKICSYKEDIMQSHLPSERK